MFLRSLVKLNNSISGILPQNSGEDQKKKVFAAFWFYLSLEFRICCCQVSIACQTTEGAGHILPPSVPDRRGVAPRPPKIDAYVASYNENFKKLLHVCNSHKVFSAVL